MSVDLRLEVSMGSLKVLCRGVDSGALDLFSITPADQDKLTGDSPWLAQDRDRMKSAVDTLLYSNLAVLGVERTNVPAEYVSACLALFVAPSNLMVACKWYADSLHSVSDLATGDIDLTYDYVSAGQLYAQCLMILSSDGISQLAAQFRARTDMPTAIK